MQRKGRRYKSRWTKKVGIKQLLATQENPRSATQEMEMRVQMLATQRETGWSDTLNALAGEQQKHFVEAWISRSNPFNEVEDTETESDNLINRQKTSDLSCNQESNKLPDELTVHEPPMKYVHRVVVTSLSRESRILCNPGTCSYHGSQPL
ncbi:uncharacterized protein LOC144622292 [Crassostrea virginica]